METQTLKANRLYKQQVPPTLLHLHRLILSQITELNIKLTDRWWCADHLKKIPIPDLYALIDYQLDTFDASIICDNVGH